MRPESEQPRESGEAAPEPYEPPLAEDLDVAEGTAATASGASGTPPGDSGTDDIGPILSDRRLKEEIEPISGALERLRSP
jgi:hypothetical protein